MSTTPEETPMTPLEARRAEVAQYQANIDMYNTILTTLPTEYPAHLEEYRGRTDQHKAIAQVEDMADVELLADLWYADQCKAAIRAETVEMTKAKRILAVLEAQAQFMFLITLPHKQEAAKQAAHDKLAALGLTAEEIAAITK